VREQRTYLSCVCSADLSHLNFPLCVAEVLNLVMSGRVDNPRLRRLCTASDLIIANLYCVRYRATARLVVFARIITFPAATSLPSLSSVAAIIPAVACPNEGSTLPPEPNALVGAASGMALNRTDAVAAETIAFLETCLVKRFI